MSATPRFAVALAAYNGSDYLEEQLTSILAQSSVEVAIFVSVDESTDGTWELVQRLAEADARLQLLPPTGRFGGAAPNFLRLLRDIDLSTFDALAFADQDDIWHRDKLARAYSGMARTGAAGYSSNVVAFWPSGRELLIDKSQPQRRWDYLFEAAGPGCTYVLRRDLAGQLQHCVRAHREALEALEYHDWLAYAFARANGAEWLIDPVVGMRYRQHDRNQIGVNAGWRSFARRAARITAGHGFAQARLIADVVGAADAPPIRLLARGRMGLLALVAYATRCRRSRRDQIFFACMCVAMAFDLRFARPGGGT